MPGGLPVGLPEGLPVGLPEGLPVGLPGKPLGGLPEGLPGKPLGGAFRHVSAVRRFNFLPHLPAILALLGGSLRGGNPPVCPPAYGIFKAFKGCKAYGIFEGRGTPHGGKHPPAYGFLRHLRDRGLCTPCAPSLRHIFFTTGGYAPRYPPSLRHF